MNHSIRPPHPAWLAVALLLACGSGCTSVLTSASLRDLIWDGDEHAAEAASAAADDEPGDPAAVAQGDDPSDTAEAGAEADAQRREAAIEEAVMRLAKLGHLDDAARATLMQTLDRTEPEDWPAVIDAFAETLADTEPVAVAVAGSDGTGPESVSTTTASSPTFESGADPHVVAKADLDTAPEADAAPAPEAAASPAPESTAAVPAPPTTLPQSTATAAAEGEARSRPFGEASPAVPPLMVRNACFATRVQAWGVVDRFPADRFRAGQEVIVYFELDGLSAGESPAGHTTCIDTTLRLVAADGRVMHDWSFEPIAETCRARRHDYFARYVVRLPETAAAGSCRIECDVTDTLSGQVATTSLPLEVVAGDPGR
jgi:hypothetical protein